VPSFNAVWISSGTGVVWGNSAPSGYSNLLSLHSMRKSNSTYAEEPTPNGWGYCGTEFNGTGANWDGNTSGTSGYPCLDQPGRGVGDLLSGDFPNVKNAVTGCTSTQPCAWPRQASEPIYEWLNTWTTAGGGSRAAVYESTVLVRNQDYYLEEPSFTGVTGTGTGTLQNRPASCAPGVAYWATDTSTLYRCSARDTWTTYYRPYTYPHPLTAASAGPAAPSQLRIIP
jgi:hypothetical protein